MKITELINAAFEAQKNSYSPYSSCKVGAALLCENENVYKGCNIENASFSPTVCAERTAFFNAVSNGEKRFKAIAIVGNNGENDFFYPCGVCRQVMNEFCDSDFKIIVAQSTDNYKILTLSELLPYGFGKEEVL
jgi:cytidine deaminase